VRSNSRLPEPAPNTRAAPFRVGLIGGLVLAIALAAQLFALYKSDPDNATVGWFVITSGMSIVGFYAARESHAHKRAQGAKAGALAGLLVGVLLTLVFVAATIAMSLNQTLFADVERMVVASNPKETLQALEQQGWTPRMIVQLSLLMVVTCCGIGFPALAVLLGALGGMGAIVPEELAK
jgi:hypothetical protein